MFVYLSKLLPLLIYPLSLACLLLVALLVLRRSPRWVLWLGLAAFLLLWLGGNRLISMTLARTLEWQYSPPSVLPHADVIVLLGGGEMPSTPPQPLAGVTEAGDRIIYAAWLYQQGAAPHVLASGGVVGVDGPALQPGAEAMGQLLSIMGVPPDSLWLEPRSRNTYENAVETKKLLDPKGIRRIILVTSALHIPAHVPSSSTWVLTLSLLPLTTPLLRPRGTTISPQTPLSKFLTYSLLPKRWITRCAP